MDCLFAKRDFFTTTNLLRGTYALSKKATIDARIRHYWSTVDIKKLYELQMDGSLDQSDTWTVNEDGTSEYERSFNALK